ncbi:MAG: glycerophosphodiester phosphodiesterase family protein [Pseudomonadota bacterium]
MLSKLHTPGSLRALLLSGLALSASVLSSCANAVPAPPSPFADMEALPPIRTVLQCLPDEAALVAAHRATSASYTEPENSLGSLERLIGHGIMMAEVDVASIADGTPILFHDGVWDEHASGTGPVVTTPPEDFARLRLKAPDGRVGGDPVPTLADLLDAAKDRIYIELDLKTSADVERAVALVRERGMTDQVLLIASTDEEAAAFMRDYGHEFLLSLPSAPRKAARTDAKPPRQGVWIGEDWRSGAERRVPQRHYVIGAQWQKNPADLPRAARALDILVTRQAERYQAVEGLENRAAFRNCLRKGA